MKVLDKGFVALDAALGDDREITRLARVSTGGAAKSEREDRNLIDYMWRHKHTSPFEMAVLRFEVQCPIFVARQMMRHRTVTIQEQSGRYVELEELVYLPPTERFSLQATDNRQGSGAPLGDEAAARAQALVARGQAVARNDYQTLLDMGVAREVARINLPLSHYTRFFWQQNLRNLLWFLQLRLDEHAQWETRQFASAMYHFTASRFPWSCEAFEEWDLHGAHLSRTMLGILRDLMQHGSVSTFVREAAAARLRKSHAREFLSLLEVEG